MLAIEANPVSFEWLEHNLRLNGVRNVTALNLGVSDHEGAMNLGVRADRHARRKFDAVGLEREREHHGTASGSGRARSADSQS